MFTNPDSGHEKGSVENAVGFIRRNLMVPKPAAQSLDGLSRALLADCQKLLKRDHYRKHEPIGQLFTADLHNGLRLPRIGFDACTWQSRIVDLVGNIHLDTVRYRVGPEYSGQQVHVGLRAYSVEVLDTNGTRIIEHKRAYGTQADTVIDPARVLPNLIKRPRTFTQSPIRSFLPTQLVDHLDQTDSSGQRRIWRAMAQACQDTDFHTVTAAITGLIDTKRPLDPANIIMAAKAGGQPPIPGPTIDLSAYDKKMKGQS